MIALSSCFRVFRYEGTFPRFAVGARAGSGIFDPAGAGVKRIRLTRMVSTGDSDVNEDASTSIVF